MPPKRKKRARVVVVKPNLGDVDVNFTKPEPIVVTDYDETTKTMTVEISIPDGVIELNNGCLVRVVGRTDGEKIHYQKGWKKDTGLIDWTPEASMPKEMFNKFIKNMEVKE